MKSLNLFVLLGISLLVSCGGPAQENNQAQEGEQTQEGNQGQDPMMSKIVGASYSQIRDVVFGGAMGEGVEWHGEALQTLPPKSIRVVTTVSGPSECSQTNCGNSVIMVNTTGSTVEVILQVHHGITDIYPYFARKINLEPEVLTFVGCSNYCYTGGAMKLTYNIVGSKIITN